MLASRHMRYWGILLVCVSCGPRPESAPPVLVAPLAPAFVSVDLLETTISPAKTGGSPWDGVGHVPDGLLTAVSAALQAPAPVAAVLEILNGPVVQGIAKPEPIGNARLIVGGQEGPVTFLNGVPGQRDTCTPQWAGPPRWSHIQLRSNTRLRVQLFDKDLEFDDAIGTFELNTADFDAALRYGRVFQVRVAEQTSQQVLFVGISVFAE